MGKIHDAICRFFARRKDRFYVWYIKQIDKEISKQEELVCEMMKRVIDGNGILDDVDFLAIENETARLHHLQESRSRMEMHTLQKMGMLYLGGTKKRYAWFRIDKMEGDGNDRKN